MSPTFHAFLKHIAHPNWHPIFLRMRIGCRAADPEPDRSTPKCRVVDHTQDFRRRFAKSPPTANTHHD